MVILPALSGKSLVMPFFVAAVHAHVKPQLGFGEVAAESGGGGAAVPDHSGVLLFIVADQVHEERNSAAGQEFEQFHRDRAVDIPLAAGDQPGVAEHAEYGAGGDAEEVGPLRPAAYRVGREVVFFSGFPEGTVEFRGQFEFFFRDRVDPRRVGGDHFARRLEFGSRRGVSAVLTSSRRSRISTATPSSRRSWSSSKLEV